MKPSKNSLIIIIYLWNISQKYFEMYTNIINILNNIYYSDDKSWLNSF